MSSIAGILEDMSFEESGQQAWQQRYGENSDQFDEKLVPFLRHRSVRKYRSEGISDATFASLLAAAQSASTSSNLQLWSAISVESLEIRSQLYEVASRQQQILDAPRFLVFCADHYRLRKAAQQVGEAAKGLDYLEFFLMAVIDAALAAERLVVAAEQAGIGICYIGAMRNQPDKVAEILGLPSGVFAPFGLCLGYPEEGSNAAIKPRLNQKAVIFTDRYDQSVECGEYDERMREFYTSQGMQGEVTWSMRSARRVNGEKLEGREFLLEWLKNTGFLAR